MRNNKVAAAGVEPAFRSAIREPVNDGCAFFHSSMLSASTDSATLPVENGSMLTHRTEEKIYLT